MAHNIAFEVALAVLDEGFSSSSPRPVSAGYDASLEDGLPSFSLDPSKFSDMARRNEAEDAELNPHRSASWIFRGMRFNIVPRDLISACARVGLA